MKPKTRHRYRALKYELIMRFMPFLERAHFPPVDRDGLAVTRRPDGETRNPVSICQWAFRWWERSTRFPAPPAVDAAARTRFMNCADWLLDHGVRRGDALVWEYDFDLHTIKAPWISGMAQGHAVQVLIRAHSLTRDEKYLRAAEQALEAFFVDIPDGGVRIVDKEPPGSWWYAEYPTPGRQRRVLNGMMFTLVGIHEFQLATGNPRAKEAFENGVRSVLAHLDEYDMGGWTRYDADGKPATPRYHQIHVNLLRRLHDATNEEKFRAYADRWDGYRARLTTPNPFTWARALLCVLQELAAFALSADRRRTARGEPVE